MARNPFHETTASHSFRTLDFDVTGRGRLLQGGADDFAAELGFAAFLFVDAVEDRAEVEPEGEAMEVVVGEFDVVVPLVEDFQQLRGVGPELARRGPMTRLVVIKAELGSEAVVRGEPIPFDRLPGQAGGLGGPPVR